MELFKARTSTRLLFNTRTAQPLARTHSLGFSMIVLGFEAVEALRTKNDGEN